MTETEIRKIGNSYSNARLCSFLLVLILLAVSVTSCVPAPWDMPGRIFHLGSALVAFLFSVAGIALYFLPTVIGALRRAKGLVGIVLVNIFLGWTFVGWVIALVWSLVGARGKA